MRTPSQSQLAGSFPVWLCEIEWHGRAYRFSSYPLTLSKSDGSTVAFDGGLEDPDFEQKMESISTDVEDDGITMELVFPVNLVKLLMVDGLSLERATGSISYVLEKGGTIQQSYEDKFALFSGEVVQPIIGDPEKPIGYVAFSLERNPLNRPVLILSEQDVIEDKTGYTSAHDSSYGQIMPFVFGLPGGFLAPDGASYAERRPFCTPAIIVSHSMGALVDGEDATIELLIAGHHVRAQTVDVLDYLGNSHYVAVSNHVDIYGKNYARVIFQWGTWDGVTLTETTGLVHPWLKGAETSSPVYWIGYHEDYGGGVENPWGGGELTQAGDVVRYFLSLCSAKVDFQAWNNIAPALNSYHFAGFINDPEVSAFEWLMDNILPHLPVEVVNGPDGLRPVLDLLIAPQYIPPKGSMIEGVGVYLNSAMESITEPDEIINRVAIRWGWSGVLDRMTTTFTLSGDPTTITGEMAGATEIARLSYSRWGDRYVEVESPYIYHDATAANVARLHVRRGALTWRSVEFVADPEWGWLHVGDVVDITSTSLHLTNARLQIAQKRWDDGAWVFTFVFEENPSLNMRSGTS